MPEQPKKLSRRDAIKVLGAAAGASVLATLPTKWTKPEITTGVLPAHAQTSTCVTVTVEAIVSQNTAAFIGLEAGPLPSSQANGNDLTATISSSFEPQGYQAVWSCMSGCLQLGLTGNPNLGSYTWRVTVNGPHSSQNDYTDTSILIDLATGLFATNYGSPPGSCTWTGET